MQPDGVVDLVTPTGTGPLWGMASAELNATLLAWPPGLVVLEGGGTAKVDDQEHELVPGSARLVEKGRTRAIRAGDEGLRYLSVHRRCGPLQVAGMPERP